MCLTNENISAANRMSKLERTTMSHRTLVPFCNLAPVSHFGRPSPTSEPKTNKKSKTNAISTFNRTTHTRQDLSNKSKSSFDLQTLSPFHTWHCRKLFIRCSCNFATHLRKNTTTAAKVDNNPVLSGVGVVFEFNEFFQFSPKNSNCQGHKTIKPIL